MSIQTELTRITNAKAAIKAAIEGKGVTVPDGTLLDGMASLIESIEAGGSGGGINATAGTITVSSDVANYVLTHGLGEVPKFFVIGMMGDYSKLSNKKHILISAYGFSDADIQYRITASSNINAPSGILRTVAITNPNNAKQSLAQANEETINVAYSGASSNLIAGATYCWLAVGSGVF